MADANVVGPGGAGGAVEGRVPRGRPHHFEPTSRRFVLPRVRAIEPGESTEEVDLVVDGGRIADRAPPGAGPREGYEVLETYAGAFVTPGLVDMHGHLPPDNVLRLTGLFLLLHLAHGVTAVRDAGDVDGTAMAAARDGLAAGHFVGPRLFAAGPFVTRGRPRWRNSVRVDRAPSADAVAAALRAGGAACMKLYENLAPDDIVALERAARDHGLVTLGHVPTPLGFEDAPLADAQHFFGVPPPASLPRDHVLDRMARWGAVDERRLDTVERAAVERQRANTPTLVSAARLAAATGPGSDAGPAVALLPRFYRDVVWHPARGLPAYRHPSPELTAALRASFDKRLALVARLHRAGAPLRLGTDVQQPFVVPGAALHEEMRLFARAGIAPREVLRLATREAARALGRPDLGSTRRGATADLLVFTRDPAADLEALDSLQAVVRDGALYPRAPFFDAARRDVARRDHGFARVAGRVLAHLAMTQAARRFQG